MSLELIKCLICVGGILGNTVAGIVLRHPSMRSPSSIILLGLALADTLYLINIIATVAFPDYYDARLWRNNVFPLAIPFWARASAQECSIFFTVAISLERYIVVCIPLEARTICTNRRALGTCLVIFPVAFILKSLRLITCVGLNDRSIPCVIHVHYVRWAEPLIDFIIPYTLLFIFNLCILRALAKARKAGSGMTSVGQNGTSTTIMLLCVVLVFGICYFNKLIDIFFGAMSFWTEYFYQIQWDIFVYQLDYEELSIPINSSLNFIIYCVFGTKFRKTLIKICSGSFCGNLSNDMSHPTNTQIQTSVL